jgi:hypothetical protein
MRGAVTTPKLPARRTGGVALAAVVGFVLGGAVGAGLATARPRTARRGHARTPVENSVAPSGSADPAGAPPPGTSAGSPLPSPPPETPLRTRSGSDRSLARMAVGAGIAVLLALTVAVVTRLADPGTAATPQWMTIPSPGPGGARLDALVAAPAGRDAHVTLAGAGGALVELKIGNVQDPWAWPGGVIGSADARIVNYTIAIRNTGTVPVAVPSVLGAWAVDGPGVNYQSEQTRGTGSTLGWMHDPGSPLDPGWQVERVVSFGVPFGRDLTRLHIYLPMDGADPVAEWTLR